VGGEPSAFTISAYAKRETREDEKGPQLGKTSGQGGERANGRRSWQAGEYRARAKNFRQGRENKRGKEETKQRSIPNKFNFRKGGRWDGITLRGKGDLARQAKKDLAARELNLYAKKKKKGMRGKGISPVIGRGRTCT